ncbi:hypothetical protein SKAU_G00353550 [Synaphobranchus kaupii]|uniref:Uncharacterized protein n=1 Tax=Synaphobranchus kaupii TaxID=118154 RepID=A0A9Q1EKY9_SYNKA|nr:hypothetical protein SKAU_G00353550 [Synaphobranchus kaupii]
MDHKLRPVDPAWLCFICSCDLWIGNLESGEEKRFTFAHKERQGCRTLQLFYEESDGSELRIINVTSPLLEMHMTESFGYPRLVYTGHVGCSLVPDKTSFFGISTLDFEFM